MYWPKISEANKSRKMHLHAQMLGGGGGGGSDSTVAQPDHTVMHSVLRTEHLLQCSRFVMKSV